MKEKELVEKLAEFYTGSTKPEIPGMASSIFEMGMMNAECTINFLEKEGYVVVRNNDMVILNKRLRTRKTIY